MGARGCRERGSHDGSNVNARRGPTGQERARRCIVAGDVVRTGMEWIRRQPDRRERPLRWEA